MRLKIKMSHSAFSFQVRLSNRQFRVPIDQRLFCYLACDIVRYFYLGQGNLRIATEKSNSGILSMQANLELKLCKSYFFHLGKNLVLHFQFLNTS